MEYQKKHEKWVKNSTLENNLKKALLNMTEKEIEDAFYTDLKFGTGGMRGIVGPGTNRMNLYTIRKANVGFAKYLLNQFKDAKERGVVIAYDNRHYSTEFAEESAKVMASFGIKAYLFDALRPTPELSFAVRDLGACGGIVVTASHNPPQYNGYKIYDENGCQLVPHLADQVIKYIEEIVDMFSIDVKSFNEYRKVGLIELIGKEIDDVYVEKVKSIAINNNLDKSKIKIVFTPLHGTANVLGQRVLKESGYDNVYLVEEQCEPDPNFSTVDSPNPENGEAFDLAIRLGIEVDADILIATDPDADRVGLAAKNKQGEYILLTGNQTGAVLLHYMLTQKNLPKNGVVYNTVVTSNLGAEIAKNHGLSVESTLTGFKYIGEKAHEIEKTNQTFFFGYEESYGYLVGDFVRDKDSIQALLMCSEAAAFYKNQNKTLYDVLFEIYDQYGYYVESLVNIGLKGKEGQDKIQKILTDFRENKPQQVNDMQVTVVEDYLSGKRYEKNQMSDLALPKANVIKFILDDNSWFVLRPSGTEPKLKIYISIVSDELDVCTNKNELVKAFVLERINKYT